MLRRVLLVGQARRVLAVCRVEYMARVGVALATRVSEYGRLKPPLQIQIGHDADMLYGLTNLPDSQPVFLTSLAVSICGRLCVLFV